MNAFNDFWTKLPPMSRLGLAVGGAVILLITLGLSLWVLKPEYQPLFVNLAPQDAAAMTGELEKMKVPYRLEGDGNTILVPSDLVHKTRLKLIGRDIPLHGAIGFELFNNSDVGMTEFSQKVNYQRALQGELTRTILSLEEVQAARVHLAIPEQGLFRKSDVSAKASVTVTLKQDKKLLPAQINGIQRLIAAAIPEIKAENVTVLDNHGVALSNKGEIEGADTGSSQEDLANKENVEKYLNRKVGEVLGRTFGAAETISTVDVVLNNDHSRITTESVVPAVTAEQNGAPTGVITRERQSIRGKGESGSTNHSEGGDSATESEYDYQVGRRVEHLIPARGGIAKLNVVVVVKKELTESQVAALKDVVGHAVGFNRARGDGIAVYSMEQFAGRMATATPESKGQLTQVDEVQAQRPTNGISEFRNNKQVAIFAGVALLLAGFLAYRLMAGRRTRRGVRPLSLPEREQLLLQVKGWMENRPQEAVGGRND